VCALSQVQLKRAQADTEIEKDRLKSESASRERAEQQVREGSEKLAELQHLQTEV